MGLFGGNVWWFWGNGGSEMWELPFPQVTELGLSKKKSVWVENLSQHYMMLPKELCQKSYVTEGKGDFVVGFLYS